MPKESKQFLKTGHNGIVVHLYHDVDTPEAERYYLVEEYGQTFTAEKLCFLIATQRKISSLAFPLFALKRIDSEIWLAPNESIECSASSSKEFIFRIRFVPPESRINTLGISDIRTFNYLFLQVRDDFIHDRIKYHENTIGQEHLLGIGVIDVVRFGKERAYDLVHLQKQDLHSFIPNSTKGTFKYFWDKHRLKWTFKPHLEKEYSKYINETDLNIKLTYIDGILSYAEHYGMEKFTIDGDSVGDNKEIIQVKPYDEQFPGLSIFSGQEHFHSLIEDLVDISISEGEPCSIHVHRKTGMPKIVNFQDRQMALSFVALLDGYYRLQVDYHHHLCRDVESPMVTSLRLIRSHGPVSKDWAAQRLLQKYNTDHDFNFLIKQKEKEIGNYVLVCLPTSGQSPQPLFWPIVRLPSGQYQLSSASGTEPVKNTVKELIEYYRGSEGDKSLRLNKCVPPSTSIDSKIYMCRNVTTPGDDVSIGTAKAKQQRAPVCLVSIIHYGQLFKEGRFTKVYDSTWNKEEEEQVVIAKQLKQNYSQLQMFFTQGIHQAVFWCHATIVTLHAMCLSNPFTVLMEKASLGSLDKYLYEPQMDLKVYHLVVAAEQIAQALLYLQEERGEVHGNIRCRNILVFKHEPRSSLLVKLGDPGMIHFYNSLPVHHDITTERLPWIAPECYNQLRDISLHSDRYSFGVMLWEMFSVGQRPWDDKDPAEIRMAVSNGCQLVQPACCPEDIFSIMKSCWDRAPDMRMKPKEIIRNIRSLLTKEGDIYNEYSDLDWLDKNATSCGSIRVNDLAANGSAVSMTLSNLAVADNDNNMRRLKQTLPQAQRVKPHPNGQVTTSQPSPSSEISLPWDSRTPLIKQESETASECSIEQIPPTSPTLSGGSNWSGNTERTEVLDNYGASFGEVAVTNDGHADGHRLEAIQSRPLPQLPHTTEQLLPSRLRCDRKQTLGQGHYGEVYAGTYTLDSGVVQPVAIKCLKSKMYQKFASEFEKEFQIMIRLKHENIVRIIGQCSMRDRDRPMLLVMEFVEKGCLRDYLPKKKSELTQKSLLQFGREIAQGMAYLSFEKVVHRDLATRNVLVTADEHMKISDFGLSRALSPERDYYKCDGNKELPAPWCAPESLTHRKFSEKSDVWSFGVTLWEIFSFGEMPNIGKIENLAIDLHQGKRLRCPKDCSNSIYKVMMFSCWQYYQRDRKTFAEILLELRNIEESLSVPIIPDSEC